MARVLVAMSGGVDSAVAAARLVADGHEVTGVHLRLADLPGQLPGHGCCTLDDAQDARRAAQTLGVPFYVWDLADTFAREVRVPFARAYAAGATPNPCIDCNAHVKYSGLLGLALERGFDALATGHHARLVRDGAPVREPGPGAVLARAVDGAKDQSYVLHMATPEELARTLLPVGELTKAEVRTLAAELGLRVAGKPDSQEVCFVEPGDLAGHLRRAIGVRTGPIVDVDGHEVGRHDGVWGFTIGQRKGLGLGDHERRFVIDLDAASATVVVGARALLECRWVELDRVSWASACAPDVPSGPLRAQVRAHGATVPARLVPASDPPGGGATVRVELLEPHVGVAVGQSLALYDERDVHCLGGGRIASADRPRLPVVARQ